MSFRVFVNFKQCSLDRQVDNNGRRWFEEKWLKQPYKYCSEDTKLVMNIMNSNLGTCEKKKKQYIILSSWWNSLICHIWALPRNSLLNMPFFLAMLLKTRWAIIKAGSQRRETLVLIIMPFIFAQISKSNAIVWRAKVKPFQCNLNLINISL